MNKITIYPEDELLEWIKDKAKEEMRSVNQQVLFMLGKEMKNEQDNRKRS